MNNGVYSMNKTMEMYCPSLKMKVEAEVIEGYAQNGKGGSPRLALKGLFEGKKTLPKKVNAETFENYGFNAEETIAAFHAEHDDGYYRPVCVGCDSNNLKDNKCLDCGDFEDSASGRAARTHEEVDKIEETYGAEQVGEPLPESPFEDAPSDTPSPIEPTNENFSAEYDEMDEVVYTGDGNDEGCSECERTIGYGEYIKVDEEGSLRICSDCYTDAPYANFSADNHLHGANCNYCGSDNLRRIRGYKCMNCANEVNYHAEYDGAGNVIEEECNECGNDLLIEEYSYCESCNELELWGAEEAVYIKGKNSKEPKQDAMFYKVGQEDADGFTPKKIVPIRTMNEHGTKKLVNAMKEADTVGSPSPSGPSEEPEPAEATGSEPSNANFSAEFGLIKNKEYICSNDGKKYQRYKLAQNPRAYEGIMMPVCWGCGGSLIESRRPGEDWRVAHTSRNYGEPSNEHFSAERFKLPSPAERDKRLKEEYARNPRCGECGSPTTLESAFGQMEYHCSNDDCDHFMPKKAESFNAEDSCLWCEEGTKGNYRHEGRPTDYCSPFCYNKGELGMDAESPSPTSPLYIKNSSIFDNPDRKYDAPLYIKILKEAWCNKGLA